MFQTIAIIPKVFDHLEYSNWGIVIQALWLSGCYSYYYKFSLYTSSFKYFGVEYRNKLFLQIFSRQLTEITIHLIQKLKSTWLPIKWFNDLKIDDILVSFGVPHRWHCCMKCLVIYKWFKSGAHTMLLICIAYLDIKYVLCLAFNIDKYHSIIWARWTGRFQFSYSVEN